MKSKAADARHRRNFLKTLSRGLAVLSAFEPDQPALILSELSAKLSLDPGTASRFLYTLEHLGYLRRESATGAYRLTARVLELGRSVHLQDELRVAARPVMEQVARETGETVSLAVRDGVDILVIDQVESRQPVAARGFLGERQPTYCTAQGKTLLAFAPLPQQQRLLSGIKFVAYGTRTIADRDSLESELKQIALRGYALNNDEMDAGVRAIAAPVCATAGDVVAALAIDVPASRVTLQELRAQYAELVISAAEHISKALGR